MKRTLTITGLCLAAVIACAVQLRWAPGENVAEVRPCTWRYEPTHNGVTLWHCGEWKVEVTER